MSVNFKSTADGMQLMAAFISQLIREGVTFKINQRMDGEDIQVELLGGY